MFVPKKAQDQKALGGSRFLVILTIVVVAAVMRLIPHPPNFTPITAMALFGGAFFARRWVGVILPLTALVLSDLVLGFHETALAVYLSFIVVAILGFGLREKRGVLRVGGTAIMGSVVFFVITNFAVWGLSGIYARTPSGFVSSYVMALPFFENALLGDMFFTGVLFGAWSWIANRYPTLSLARVESQQSESLSHG